MIFERLNEQELGGVFFTRHRIVPRWEHHLYPDFRRWIFYFFTVGLVISIVAFWPITEIILNEEYWLLKLNITKKDLRLMIDFNFYLSGIFLVGFLCSSVHFWFADHVGVLRFQPWLYIDASPSSPLSIPSPRSFPEPIPETFTREQPQSPLEPIPPILPSSMNRYIKYRHQSFYGNLGRFENNPEIADLNEQERNDELDGVSRKRVHIL